MYRAGFGDKAAMTVGTGKLDMEMSDTSFGLRAPVPLSKMDGRPHFPESNYVREREQWSACLRMMREMCWGDILGHTALTCVLFSQCLTGLLKHPQAQCTQAREERRHHWAFNYRETEYCHHHSAFNFTDDSYSITVISKSTITPPDLSTMELFSQAWQQVLCC